MKRWVDRDSGEDENRETRESAKRMNSVHEADEMIEEVDFKVDVTHIDNSDQWCQRQAGWWVEQQ